MFLQLLYFEKDKVFYEFWVHYRMLPSDTKAAGIKHKLNCSR